jgi:hypothetical protein
MGSFDRILSDNFKTMNPQSKLLLVIGVFVFSATCFGQQPCREKSMKHFATDILTVDSILSTSSHSNKQRISNIPLPKLKLYKENTRFESNREEGGFKGASICPTITEMIRPKKI